MSTRHTNRPPTSTPSAAPRAAVLALTLAAVAVAPGCSMFRWMRPKAGPPKVTASQFYTPPTDAAPNVAPNVTPTTAPLPPVANAGGTDTTFNPAPSLQIDNAGRATLNTSTPLTPPAAPPEPTPAASRPVPPSVSTVGTYMTIGGVVSEVNGVPIFASRVMKLLDPVLSARAKDLDERAFQLEAQRNIDRQISELEREEVEYALAQRNLTAEDKTLADNLTTDWRQKQITAAGGSLQQARRAAFDAGEDFDQLVRNQARVFFVQVYYQKKVIPRIQVTTDQMRKYYRDNLDKLFTQRSEVTFRLIRVDPARTGGKQPALDKIVSLRDRAARGEDFTTLASTLNDDASLARRGGLVDKVSKGSLALERVEDAVFRTEPGQLTEVVEDRGGFYLARVEARTLGTVQPFEDPKVQDRVRTDLRNAEFARLRAQIRDELIKNSIVRRDQRMLTTALEMATQRYPLWRDAK